MGAKKGDVMGLVVPNIPEFPIAFLGACGVGVTLTTMNPTYRPGERGLSHKWRYSYYKALLNNIFNLDQCRHRSLKVGTLVLESSKITFNGYRNKLANNHRGLNVLTFFVVTLGGFQSIKILSTKIHDSLIHLNSFTFRCLSNFTTIVSRNLKPVKVF